MNSKPIASTPVHWTPASNPPDADISYLLLVADCKAAKDRLTAPRDWFAGHWDGIGWVDDASGGYIESFRVLAYGDVELPEGAL